MRGRARVHGGGNLRQEAWSVRRSHPTGFHREATLIADVLEATMDVGHDDQAGNVRRWRAERRRAEHPPDFRLLNTLSHQSPPSRAILAFAFVHSCMDALLSSHRIPRRNVACTLLSPRFSIPLVSSFQEATRDENRTTMMKALARRR